MNKILISFCLFVFLSTVKAQVNPMIEKYNRAVEFSYENLNNKKVFNLELRPNWFPDSTGFWYTQHFPERKLYMKFIFSGAAQAELFDHEKLAEILGDSLHQELDPFDLPIDRIEYKNPREFQIQAKGKTYILNTEKHTLGTIPEKEDSDESESHSPDKQWIAYTEDYNLYLKKPGEEESRQLSTRGEELYEYASWYGWDDIMVGEGGRRPERFYVNWSPDSKWIQANICDLRSANKMYLLDWSVDTLYRPRLLSYYRGSPGDTGMIYIKPVFFNVESGKEISPPLPRSTHINLISVRWSDTPGRVYLERSSRGYKSEFIYSYDLNTEELRTLYAETSPTNIDNFNYELAEESGLLFFLSEKSGWRQLYSIDLESMEEKPVTGGKYYIHRIVHIDEESEILYFTGSGMEPGQNPYYQKLYRISFKGKQLKELTPGNLNHSISMAPGGACFVDNIWTVNSPTVSCIRDTRTGRIIRELGRADVSRLEGWKAPEIFTAHARDGKTTLYGAMWKPTDFDPSRKYPVIDNSYTGPHTFVFPTRFNQALRNQAISELGFIVIMVDGLGSAGRSKEFHDYSYKNLGGNLEDHVRAIRQLGKKHPWVDTSRVGIFGHSAGGYDAAHALLAYPGFYKVGVASSADHDHRMEKAWWPEMYMGWPVDSAYHLQSNVTLAGNLKGKLLITHGGIDENVNPSATFKLAEALVKADKEFDMLIFPSQRHGYRGDYGRYFTKTRWNYLVKHLLGEEPVWDIDWKTEEK